jgi:protoporphyrinogen oxidase
MACAHADTLILGGGLTGLAAAHFLAERGGESLVLEREADAGGLARSYRKDGFTCDLTGHLLHLRKPENRAFVKNLLRGNWTHVERNSAIYSHGATTPYPFQVNLAGLPPEVTRECLLGFVEAWQRKKQTGTAAPGLSFRRWIMDTFGEGIARHFMIPYNEKMWRTDLDLLTADWVSWSVPQPSLDDVVKGALGIRDRAFGYNPTFFYPEEGGIGAFSGGLARRVPRLRLGAAARSVDMARRRVRLDDGTEMAYNRLISTLPLPRLAAMAEGLPVALRRQGGKLRHVNVLNFNLGFRGTRRCESHWTYFPEREFVFYRVGFPTNFAPALAPRGCSAAYVEISLRAGERPDVPALYRRVVEGLKRWGVLTRESDIVMADAKLIEPAYVLFDRARAAAVGKLRSHFEKRGVVSAGRYGQWDYLSMEDSLNIGRDLAGGAA